MSSHLRVVASRANLISELVAASVPGRNGTYAIDRLTVDHLLGRYRRRGLGRKEIAEMLAAARARRVA